MEEGLLVLANAFCLQKLSQISIYHKMENTADTMLIY